MNLWRNVIYKLCQTVHFTQLQRTLTLEITTMHQEHLTLHKILSTNPVGTENWVYTHFFKHTDEEGKEHVVLDDERLYKKKTIVVE